MKTTKNAYLGFYPIQPFVQTKEDDLTRLFYTFRTFLPWEPVFVDETIVQNLTDDELERDLLRNACLSDIIGFQNLSATGNIHDNPPEYNVSLSPENADGSYSGITMTLSTDLSSVRVAYPDFKSTNLNYFGSGSSTTTKPSTFTNTDRKFDKNASVNYDDASSKIRHKTVAYPTGFGDPGRKIGVDTASSKPLKEAGEAGEVVTLRRVGVFGTKGYNSDAYTKNVIPQNGNTKFYCPDGVWKRDCRKESLTAWGGQVRIQFSLREVIDKLTAANGANIQE